MRSHFVFSEAGLGHLYPSGRIIVIGPSVGMLSPGLGLGPGDITCLRFLLLDSEDSVDGRRFRDIQSQASGEQGMWRKKHLVFCWGRSLLCKQRKGKLGFQGAMWLSSYPDLEEPRSLLS